MAKTFNRMRIDVNEGINSIGINPVQNDTRSRYLDVCLYNNGLPIDLTGEVVRINFEKEDGTAFFNQGEITNAAEGRCQFALTNEVLSDAKVVKAQISIWSGEGQILSTQVFTIYVTESIRNDEEVESTNEFGVLVVLFQEIQNSLELMQAIAENFGDPGEKAAEFGAETFWQMLEILASRTDVQGALRGLIKETLNSTIDAGMTDMIPLNELILNAVVGDEFIFRQNGTIQVPAGVEAIQIIAAGGGGGGQTGELNAAMGGGSGGCCIDRIFAVEPGTEIPITIGEGGAAGKNGGATVVGDLVTVAGGLGNNSTGGVASAGEGSGAGSASGKNGGDGLYGAGGKASLSSAGGGGGGSYGKGGDGGNSPNRNGSDGIDGGGGGGGDSSWGKGGKGGDGIVIIRWGARMT